MRQAVKAPLLVLALGFALSALYQLSQLAFSDLVGPLVVNATLLVILSATYPFWIARLNLAAKTNLWSWFCPKSQRPPPGKYLVVAIASLSPLLLALGAGLATRAQVRDAPGLDNRFWLAVALIPVVEELLFRGFISRWAQLQFGKIAGIYWASLLFAFVHAIPQLTDLNTWGLPTGPFVLALCVEGLRLWSGRFWPCIIFHMAANATVPLFFWLDPRWLDWLSPLYLN